MKYLKLLFAITLVFTVCSAFTAKKGEPKDVYAFGLSASFTDTVVYYTSIQLLDSVQLDKNGFLPQREQYSYQLKNFLEFDMQKPNYTCMIYFSENKSKLEKEAAKMLARYKKNKSNVLELLNNEKFSFQKPEE